MAAPARVPDERPAGDRRDRQAEQHEQREAAVDHAHAAVLVEVLGVLARVRAALGGEEPAGVRVPEAAQHAGGAVAVADVRAVRVALLVGVGVVLAVVGHPAHHGALDRHRAEHGEAVLERLGHEEGAVGEQPVEADGDAEAGEHVHHGQDHEVGRGHRAVPEQDDRREEGHEGEHHGGEVDALFKIGHYS